MVTRHRVVEDCANTALRYASSFIDELALQGLAHCVICPGSRSTPLTLAVTGHPRIHAWTQVDERSACYFALGLAKALRSPVAIVCTSGTAAANLFPAIVEAHHAMVPLLALTADRPPELRDTGALQAIDQLKLYGGFVKKFVEMALPEDGPETLRYARTVAAHMLRTASFDPPGPVHVNFPFREPLVPEDGQLVDAFSSQPAAALVDPVRTLRSADVDRVANAIHGAARGLIICGPQDDPDFPMAISALSQATAFPVLAGALSQLRSGSDPDWPVFDNYDIFLRNRRVSTLLRPDLILRFGMTPTSKALNAFLSEHAAATHIGVHGSGRPNDPTRTLDLALDADPSWLARELAGVLGSVKPASEEWINLWRRVSGVTRVVTEAHMAASEKVSEITLFPTMSEVLPEGAVLFVGNSMPLRDLDGFFPNSSKRMRVMANRGVNGIDGVISTALGVAAATCRRVVLVLGDLSFYHDMNGLLAAKLHDIDLTIILVNNNGGGIFEFLPQSRQPDTFESYFAMPTGLDFQAVVEMYGGRFGRAETREEFTRKVFDSWSTTGLTVIEVRADRAENAQDHHALWEAVVEALDQAGLG